MSNKVSITHGAIEILQDSLGDQQQAQDAGNNPASVDFGKGFIQGIAHCIDLLESAYAKRVSNIQDAVEFSPKWYTLEDGEGVQLPDVKMEIMEDGLYMRTLEDDNLLHVGYIPMPRSRFGWFLYHLIHGAVMRYPLHKVIGFAWVYSRGDVNE